MTTTPTRTPTRRYSVKRATIAIATALTTRLSATPALANSISPANAKRPMTAFPKGARSSLCETRTPPASGHLESLVRWTLRYNARRQRNRFDLRPTKEPEMKRALITILSISFCLVSSPLSASIQEPDAGDIIAKIKDEAMKRSQVEETFTHFTEDIGPRLTGTPAQKQAAEYAVEKLKAWGLTNVHLDPWKFGRGWAMDKLTLEMTEPRYLPLIGYGEAWSPSSRGEVVGPPIFLGDKTQDLIEQMRPRLKGAIVLSQAIQTVFE